MSAGVWSLKDAETVFWARWEFPAQTEILRETSERLIMTLLPPDDRRWVDQSVVRSSVGLLINVVWICHVKKFPSVFKL